MADLNDPQVRVALLMHHFGRHLDPETKAAGEACMRAMAEPGCLVRVTFTDIGQVQFVCGAIESTLRHMRLYDQNKTMANLKAGRMIFELTNGSGIEFANDADKMLAALAKAGHHG